ncbi:MAG: hypothetical protein AB1332_02735 [Pseudomonadota bacterium]|jgi:hypothetical protein
MTSSLEQFSVEGADAVKTSLFAASFALNVLRMKRSPTTITA